MSHRHRSRRHRQHQHRHPSNPPARPPRPRSEAAAGPTWNDPAAPTAADGHRAEPPRPAAEPDLPPLTPDTWPDVLRSARPLDGHWRKP